MMSGRRIAFAVVALGMGLSIGLLLAVRLGTDSVDAQTIVIGSGIKTILANGSALSPPFESLNCGSGTTCAKDGTNLGQVNITASGGGGSASCDGGPCVTQVTGTAPISSSGGASPAISINLDGSIPAQAVAWPDSGIRTLTSGSSAVSASATNTLGPFTLASDGSVITEQPACRVIGTDNVAGVEFCCPCGAIRGTDGVSCDYEQTVDAGTYTLRCRNWSSVSTRNVQFMVKGESLYP